MNWKKLFPKPPIKHLFDAWSLSHFFFGVVIAMFILVFEIPWWFGVLFTLVAAVVWEYFEMALGIKESRWNVISDVTLPTFAYMLFYLFFENSPIEEIHRTPLLVVSIIIFIAMNVAAWSARWSGDREFLD